MHRVKRSSVSERNPVCRSIGKVFASKSKHSERDLDLVRTAVGCIVNS
jgi:hypothetical protein